MGFALYRSKCHTRAKSLKIVSNAFFFNPYQYSKKQRSRFCIILIHFSKRSKYHTNSLKTILDIPSRNWRIGTPNAISAVLCILIRLNYFPNSVKIPVSAMDNQNRIDDDSIVEFNSTQTKPQHTQKESKDENLHLCNLCNRFTNERKFWYRRLYRRS